MTEPLIEVRKKHPLSIRWNHWINFPLLCIMVWSGLCIYWANAVYVLPRSWLNAIGLQYNLGPGLAWHWAFAVLFTVNWLCYFAFLAMTGHWRYVVPKKRDFVGSVLVILRDFRLIKSRPPIDVKYNSAQKLAYSTVLILGFVMILTGFAIYKPVQLSWLARVFGGYEGARFIHFYSTLFLMVFFVVHLIQVARAGWNQLRAMITGIEKVGNENT